MTAARYLALHFEPYGISVLILSDDPEFAYKHFLTEAERWLLATAETYVSTLTSQFSELEDKLCRTPYNEDESKEKDFMELYSNFRLNL